MRESLGNSRSIKRNPENAEFRRFLLCDPEPIRGDSYTDRIFKSNTWSSLLNVGNRLILYLLTNVNNTSLQGRDTAIRRSLYENFRPREGNLQAPIKPEVPEDTSAGNLCKQRNQGRARTSTQQNAISTRPPSLRVSDGSAIVYGFLVLLQVGVFAHYLISVLILSDPYNKRLAITCSKTLQTIQTLVFVQNKSLCLTDEGGREQDLHLKTNQTVDQLAHCLNQLEWFISERYENFYVWNVSDAIPPSWPFYRLINDYLLPEQSKPLQMFADEVRLFCHAIGAFLLSSSLIGWFLNKRMPYDITALVFLYDPLYTATYTKWRVHCYLRLVRRSYRTFWSMYRLDENRSMHKSSLASFVHFSEIGITNISLAPTLANSKLDTPSRAMLLSTKLMEPNLSGPQGEQEDEGQDAKVEPMAGVHTFSSYLPTARRQSWRSKLMLVLPTYQVASSLFSITALILLYLVFTSGNSRATELNHELKLFLRDGLEPEGFAATVSSHCLHTTESGLLESMGGDVARHRLAAFVRRRLVKHMAATLLALSNNQTSRLRRDHMVANVEPLNTRGLDLERGSIDDWLLAVNSIEPTTSLALDNWLIAFLGAVLCSVLGTLHFTVFFIVLSDLCFWLFEIRTKLDICKVLLIIPSLRGDQVPLLDSPQLRPPVGLTLTAHTGHPTGSLYTSPAALADHRRRYAMSARVCGGVGQPPRDQPHRRAYHSFDSDTSHCNVGTRKVFRYLGANQTSRMQLCFSYANDILATGDPLPGSHWSRPTRAELLDSRARSFLLSTYLDFRLFLDQIDTCRKSINFMLSYAVMHGLNLIAVSQLTEFKRSKFGFLATGYGVINFMLLGSCFFQSQCASLVALIHSILSASTRGNHTVRHLGSLWRRALLDLSDSRSKFTFRVYSVNISYATALQFNLGVASLYLLTFDKMRYH